MSEVKNIVKRFLSLTLIFALVAAMLPAVSMPVNAATNGTVTGLSDENIGLSFTGTADNAWSATGTQIIGKARSTSGAGCGSNKDYRSTLTITNKKTTRATLSFDYTVVVSEGTILVDNTTTTANGSFSNKLEAGGTVVVEINSGSTSADTKITMTNVKLVSDVNATVTFQPAENGSYTVDGKAITEAYTNTQSSMTAYQVAATPAEGYRFKDWYDVIGRKSISTDAKTSLNFDSDRTVTARFVSKELALFETGGQIFDDLNEAVAEARKNLPAIITLAESGKITGNYTIPSKVTLLIPFDEAKTCYTSTPTAITSTPTAKPFRTLTMAEGSSITLENGAAISVGGQYYAAAGGSVGKMVGPYGWINMKSGSAITVQGGATLYAWGFISGSGAVTVESGGSVYEWYQILDFRGGSASSEMGNNVFPFSQYAVQNVEVPLTLHAGANETVYTAVYAIRKINPTSIPFIGSNGMFKLVSGSLTKAYDGATDRIHYTIDGVAEVNSLNLKLAGMKVSSSGYVLPLTNNMTINLTSDSKLTINQTAALLPGVEATIAKGAELVVSSGESIYIYDRDEWGGYCGAGDAQYMSVVVAPGRTGKRAPLADVQVDVNGTLTAIGGIYTTASGADICSSAGTGAYNQQGTPGAETKTYQYTQKGSVTAHEIPITPAKLHNEDGSYTETATANTGDVINYVNGVWGGEEPVELTVTFEANGSAEYPVEGTMTPQTVNAKTDTALSANSFTRKGYNFLKWNTAADGTGDSYADGATVNLTADTTLYAQWEDNHSLTKVINKKDATCTEDGYTGDTVCAICGKEITKGETIQSKGHTEVIDAAKAPTCTKSGKTEGKHCSVCNAIIVAQTEIPATGHTEKTVVGKPATCTETGLTDGISCSICGTVIKAQEEIPAKGHTEVIDARVEPTCTKSGKTEGKHCSVCNEVLVAQEVIPAKGHTEVIDPAVEPTCTEPGKTEGKHCSVCNEVLVAQTEVLALGHKWNDGEVTQKANCTETGVKTYTCNVCKETKTQEIPATGHNWTSEWSKDETGHWHECQNEGCTEKGDFTEHAATGIASKQATCTETGLTDGKKCSQCGYIIEEQKEIPKIDHNWDEGEITTGATCTEKGERTFTCTMCHITRAEEIAATGHTEIVDKAVEATCMTAGKTEGKHCSVCNEVLVKQEAVPALGHAWNDGEVTTAPTCTTAGEKTYTCTHENCGATKKEVVAATGHTEIVDKAVEATCTTAGKTEGKHCSVCNEVLVAQTEILATGHKWGSWIKVDDDKHKHVCENDENHFETAAHSWDEGKITTGVTCEEAGEKTYTCSDCGATKTEAVDKLEHSWETVWSVDKEATCKEEGSKSHHCKNCDAKTDVTVIPTMAHNYQNGKCTYCGEVKHTSSSGNSRDYVTNVNTDDAKTTVANIIPRNNGKLNISDAVLKEIFSKATANSSTKVVIRVHHKYTNSSSVYQINLSQDMIDNLIKDNKYELVINTGQGEFTLNAEILKTMSAKAADGISVTSRELDQSEMTKKQKAACGEYGSIIQLIATDSKGEIIWSGDGAHTAAVEIPDKLAGKDVKILVIDKYGLYRELGSSIVEQNGKKYLSFSSDGAARYIITDSDNAVSLFDKQDARLKKLEKGVKKTKLKLNVSVTSKGNMKLTWKKSKGYNVDYYQVYRAVKKKGFGKKAFYQNSSDIRKYINTKNLKQGKRYYYKVRGVRLVGDKLVYTGWSNIDSEIAD